MMEAMVRLIDSNLEKNKAPPSGKENCWNSSVFLAKKQCQDEGIMPPRQSQSFSGWVLFLAWLPIGEVVDGQDRHHRRPLAGDQRQMQIPMMANCTSVEEVWRPLCERGGCAPRHDAGCTKPGASGICSSSFGCVQGEFQRTYKLHPGYGREIPMDGAWRPPRGHEAQDEDFMYLDILEPVLGQRFPLDQPVHVRFQVEVRVHRERAEQIDREARSSALGLASVPELGGCTSGCLRGVILIDDDEVWVGGGEGGPVSAKVVEVFFRGNRGSAEHEVGIVSLEVEHKIEGLSVGGHTARVQLLLSGEEEGNLPLYMPTVVWFEVVEEGSRESQGEESRQVLLEKVQSLENELSWLRMRMKRLGGDDKEEDKSRNPRHLVFELGAHDGIWISSFLQENPHFEPHIFEPQPQFQASLSDLARHHKGQYHQKVAWITTGERKTFHAHRDEFGVGSSLYEDAVYVKCGAGECHKDDDSEEYEVETVDFAGYLKKVARPTDVIIVRMDIEGAEYEVARRMVLEGVACWIDYWEFEGHSMYSPSMHKYRQVDGVLAWLLRPCGVQLVVQDWYTEDSRVFEEWPDSDPCKTCPMPAIEG